MEIILKLTLEDRLFNLLEDKLPSLGKRVECAVKKEITAQARENIAVTVSALGAEQVRAAPADGATAGATDVEASAVIDTTAEEGEAAELTIDDAREAIERARIRIEGDDRNEPTSERYVKYHKAINRMCKLIIGEISPMKAAKLPELAPDLYPVFIEKVDALELDAEGNLSRGIAPY